MDVFVLIVRFVLFVIFALAATGKFYDLAGSKRAVESFGVPKSISGVAGLLLPIVELSIALLFLPVQTSFYAGIMGAGLMLLFIAGMIYQISKGNAPDCHCFGQIHSEPVSKKSLLRNFVFLLLALVLVVRGTNGQGTNILENTTGSTFQMNGLQLILGLAIIAFLAAVVYFLKKISEQQTQIMRRIEMLEIISSDGGREVQRNDVQDPKTGLPVGSKVPEFSVKGLNGGEFSREDLFNGTEPTLLFFVSPSCTPCKALIPEIQEWQRKLSGRTNFAFISTGEIKENIEKFGDKGFDNFYIQKDNVVSEMLDAKWTPTALLVGPDGRVLTHPAAGDAAIANLIEKISNTMSIDGFFYFRNGDDDLIGEDVPAFEAEDLNGNTIKSEDLKDSETLVAYWSTTCPHCVNLLSKLRNWDEQRIDGQPNLLVLSSGDEEPNRDMGFVSPVIVDNDHELAKSLKLTGTPSGILIGRNGKVISEIGVGASNIWALLGVKKNEGD
ncbi:MAG: MauE/DoxX family redox-associated membrane protein [Pyrinomonadaceae bacterium]